MTLVVMPVINLVKCNGCGLCIDVCARNAIVRVSSVVTIIETEECGWCLQCEVICPTGALVCPYEIVLESNQKASIS